MPKKKRDGFPLYDADKVIARMKSEMRHVSDDDPEKILVELAEKVVFTEFGYRSENEEFVDLIMEAYAQIPKILSSYDPEKGTTLTTWGWRLMTNACLNMLRKVDRKRRYETQMEHWQEANEFDFTEDGEQGTSWQTDCGWMQEPSGKAERAMTWAVDWELVLRALEPREAKILEWSLEGISQTEMAEKLGISQSRVSRLMKEITRKCQSWA